MITSTSLDFPPVEFEEADAPAGEDHAAALEVSHADHERAVAAAYAEGVLAGMGAERDRLKAVTSSEHYAGREKSALTLLTTTDMTAEQITGVLASFPVAASAAAPAQLPVDRSQNALGGLVVVASGGD